MGYSISGKLILREGLFKSKAFSSEDQVSEETINWGAATITETRLQSPTIDANDYFGTRVSYSPDGNYLLISSSNDEGPAGTSVGSLYIFEKINNVWTEVQKIYPPDSYTNQKFGQEAKLSGDNSILIIGSSETNARGALYIYNKVGSTWQFQTKITPAEQANYDYFGWYNDISYDGSTIIAGSYQDDDQGSASGSAYIYTYNGSNWILEQKIYPSDAGTNKFFGLPPRLSSDGNVAAISGPGDNGNSGAIYIFTRTGTTWYQTAKLSNPNPNSNDYFGEKMAMSKEGDLIVANSKRSPNNFGSVYIFSYNGSDWNLSQTLIPSDSLSGDNFGTGLELNHENNKLVIGAQNHNSSEGKVYIFGLNNGSWLEEHIISNPNPNPAEYFGSNVDISPSGDEIIVGAYWDNSDGNYSGSAYVFKAS